MTSRLRLVAVVVAAWLGGSASKGQNLLFNPEFDTALLTTGWSLYFGADLDWTGVDATGCPDSGAAQVASATTDVDTQWLQFGQCQEAGGAGWETGAHAAFSYFSFDATLAYASFFFYSDTTCGLGGGSYLGVSNQTGPTGAGWHRAAISQITFPAGTASIFVSVGAEAAQPTPIELLADRAYFGHLPEIFADGFETAGTACRWSIVIP